MRRKWRVLMPAPNGIDEILKYYGNIHDYVRDDGTIVLSWEMMFLVSIRLPGPIPLSWDPAAPATRIRCHCKIAREVSNVMGAIASAGLWPEMRDFGGCYAFRAQRGSPKLSLHAFGAALDLNVATNPRGSVGDMHPGIVQAFEAEGFEWGGRWQTPDPMHFQYATGY